MPVYEFLCAPCNRIFSFHSFKVDPDKVPACPKCGATDLRRVPSRFGVGAASKTSGDEAGGDLDDPRLEREMMKLMRDAEHMDENDPRTGKNLQTLISQKYMPVANADLLSCDGTYVYMQAQKFENLVDMQRKAVGLLEDLTADRVRARVLVDLAEDVPHPVRRSHLLANLDHCVSDAATLSDAPGARSLTTTRLLYSPIRNSTLNVSTAFPWFSTRADGPADLALEGFASDLYLAVWNRGDDTALETSAARDESAHRVGGAGARPAPLLDSVDIRPQKTLALVADDSITMRKVTTRVLESHDFEVVTARDGVEATETMQERVPDLLLLDIEMPRMDGYQVAEHVRADARLRDVPIIMITSRAGKKHRDRGKQAGANAYLSKPYKESELIDEVRKLLRSELEQDD